MRVQRTAEEWLDLLRSQQFQFASNQVSKTYPWWSRPDFGILEWLGRPVNPGREPTQIHVAAYRPNSVGILTG